MMNKEIGRSVVLTETDVHRLRGFCHSRQGRVSYGSLVRALEQELGRGVVVAPGSVPRDVVTMNSKVRVRDVRSESARTFTLVYPENADITEGRLSVVAPLGRAILGARVGDIVEVDAPVGVLHFKIERLVYQPEAAGDLHL